MGRTIVVSQKDIKDKADKARFYLDTAKTLALSLEGELWGHFPLDTTNMQWARFTGVLLKEPFNGVWVRERSEAPESFVMSIEDALSFCRAIEPDLLHAEIERLRAEGGKVWSEVFKLRKMVEGDQLQPWER